MLFADIFASLNDASARYVVVGGVATVLHGFARLTADLDLMIDLDPSSAARVMDALTGLGLRPRAPVDARLFADPAQRRAWITDKGMRVFSLWDPARPLLEVDLFVEHPIPFEQVYARSEVMEIAGLSVRVAGLDDLIALKRLADRPQDRIDIDALTAIKARRAGGGAP